MMKKKGIALMALSVLSLAGCGMQSTPEIQPTLNDQISLYCLDHQGSLEMRENQGKLDGYCIFSDRSECPEADFFNAACQPGMYFGDVKVQEEIGDVSSDQRAESELLSGTDEGAVSGDSVLE